MRAVLMLSVLVVMSTSAAVTASAQLNPLRGVVPDPCAQALPPGQTYNLDFGQLCKYEAANAHLPPATDHRVVYFGDSLTELWGNRVPGLQADDVINRGISGQTTAQMLVRFKSDVLNLKPRIVHLLMGTNDVAGNTGATTLKRIEDAISSMAEQARANGIRVVIASILPMKTVTWRTGIDPVPPIHDLNVWIKSYAAREGFTYVDYFSVLDDGTSGFKAALTSDGVHPNKAGYDVMIPIAADALQRANR